MTATDQNKILDAGFTIIRERDAHIPVEAGCFQLVQKVKERKEWHVYSRDTTKAERARVKKRLLQNPKIVED
jgi:hypothetical protein